MLVTVLSFVVLSSCFQYNQRVVINKSLTKSTNLKALSNDVITQLDEMKAKYERLNNVDSAEATEEMKKIEEIVQKYKSYKEVRIMMS